MALIEGLSRKKDPKHDPDLANIGSEETAENKGEFTEQQIKEGRNVIGLQMGSYKGASQAGDHFGRPKQVAGKDCYK